MIKISIPNLTVITLFITVALAIDVQDRKIFFLYNDQQHIKGVTFEKDLPQVKFVNCQSRSCKQFKTQQFPSLLSWGGPGTSYREITPPNNEGLKTYLKNWVEHPLHPLRVFIASMNIPQTIIFALLANIPLYLLFRTIFYNRNKNYKRVDDKEKSS